jgi:G3E family GTPase
VSNENPPLPLLLVTGFLGSGKTTLINRWLRTRTGAKLGVLVNEFGQIGIDGALLGPGDVLELSDGCVCCASGRELWESARDLGARSGVTHLLVETSGIADPGVLLQQYEELPTALLSSFELRGVLCLVDTLHIEASLARRAEARRQVLEADRLILSKADLCPGERLAEVHTLLDEMGATPERAVIGPGAGTDEVAQALAWAFSPPRLRAAERTQDTGHRHDPPHPDGQLSAVSVAERRPLLETPLRRLLSELPDSVLRAKGFVRLVPAQGGDVQVAVVQRCGTRVELRPATVEEAAAAPAGSTLVFIGEGLDRSEAWLRLRLSACRVPDATRGA